MSPDPVAKSQASKHEQEIFRDDKALEAVDNLNADDQDLVRLGKKPVLKRDFNFLQILGLVCTLLTTWEGVFILANPVLENGGTAGAIWGFLFCWIGSLSFYTVLAELSSMAPTSAGQYHWVAMMSPPSCTKFMSYTTGWLTVVGWQATNLSTAYLTGSITEAMIGFVHPSFETKAWHSLLFTWAVLLGAVFINSISTRALARFEGTILFAHLLGFVAFLVPLVYYGPHGNASVFTTLNNGGGWSSNALSFFVGLPTFAFTMFGADSAVHMSEEIRNASTVVPKTIVLSVLLNGALAWAMLFAMVLSTPDVLSSLQDTSTSGYAFLDIFTRAVRTKAAALGIGSFFVTIGTISSVGTIAASSRLLWAFARDRGVPGSAAISRVNSRTVLPINSLLTTLVVDVLVALISLGTSVALNDVLSLTIIGMYSSYLISTGLLLYRRVQGKVSSSKDGDGLVTGPNNLRWGSWKVPEPFGTINNGFACFYLIWILFWCVWPPFANPTGATMNFSVVVFSAVVIFSVLWYVLRAHKYYKGPVIEL